MDILLVAVCAAIVSTLATVIYLNNRRKEYAVWFVLLCVALIVWVGANYLTNHYLGYDRLVELANVTAYVSALLAFFFGSMFSYNFPVKDEESRSEQQAGTFATMAVAVLSFSPVISGEIEVKDGLISYSTGQGVWLYFLMMTVLLGVTVRNLYMARKSHDTRVHTQVTIILIAVLVSGAIGLGLNIVMPSLGFGWDGTRVGPFSVVIFTSLVAYSIIKHNLFDVRLAAVRTLGYSLTLLTLIGVYFMAGYILSNLLVGGRTLDGDLVTPLNILLALVLAVIFQPVKRFFDKTTDHIFYHSQYGTDEFISELGDALTSTVHLREMLAKASAVMVSSLHASSLSFVVYREDHRSDMVVTDGKKAAFTRDDIEELKGVLAATSETAIDLQRELIDDPALKILEKLRKKHYALLLPLGEQLGFVLIRERLRGSYSERDMRVLAAISDQLTIAIQNARSVEGLHELNATLQQRIDKATRQLRNTNSKLRKLDETKDEFVSMASHQLRTPLTSVKGYVSMLLEGDAGKLTKQQEKLLQEAFVSSERMVRLIGDFLNVSRLQTGKFMIDTHAIDMVQLVEEEIASIRGIAESHGQEVDYRGPTGEILVDIDADKTRQVIMNFIDNAIYYSPSTSTITVKLHAAKNKVIFEVHDKGIGVPKEQQAQLFTKFFRADNARKQRPDGTGVGLFLAKKVIEAQGGEIIFHSREGMGSVFGFSLPIKK